MRTQTTRLHQWALQKAASERAPVWIAVLFGLELVLFLPLDALLMFFCLQNRKKTFLYVTIAAIASTFSGLVGYLLGHFLWDLIGPFVVPQLISLSSFDRMAHHFHMYENWAIFFGGILPFPLKALSLCAGVFQVGAGSFFAYLIVARWIRFAVTGAAVVLWGESVKNFVDRHFQKIVVLIGAKVAMAFFFVWVLAR